MANTINEKYMRCKVFNNLSKRTRVCDLPDASLYDFATEDAPQIIVRKNPFNQYRTREILTNVPFDTIYTVYPRDYGEHAYLIGVPFKKYSCFIKEDSWLDYEQLEKYISEHKDIEAYRQYLLFVKAEAKERCERFEIEERNARSEENEMVRKLIKDARR